MNDPLVKDLAWLLEANGFGSFASLKEEIERHGFSVKAAARGVATRDLCEWIECHPEWIARLRGLIRARRAVAAMKAERAGLKAAAADEFALVIDGEVFLVRRMPHG